MDLVCHLTVVGGRGVLLVSGEIDLATIPGFRDHITRALGEHAGETLFIDLDGVSALDDTGLGMLLGAAGRAREADGDVVLVCSNERLLQRFATTGLDRAITVRPRISD
jgi:anti-sigma B factor antagonist